MNVVEIWVIGCNVACYSMLSHLLYQCQLRNNVYIPHTPPNLRYTLFCWQIFQLMKQDSYPRFLKSELYKQCVVAEMEGKPLPFSGQGDDEPRPREEKKVGTRPTELVGLVDARGGSKKGNIEVLWYYILGKER